MRAAQGALRAQMLEAVLAAERSAQAAEATRQIVTSMNETATQIFNKILAAFARRSEDLIPKSIEADVTRMIGLGLDASEIAERFGLSVLAVFEYRRRLSAQKEGRKLAEPYKAGEKDKEKEKEKEDQK